MDYGLFQVHANGRIIGICGYLIETDAAERILVDTGFPQKYVDDGAQAAAQDDLGRFGVVLELGAANTPAGQLALCGLKVTDIDILIMTHSHIDHIGHIATFAGVPIVMAAAERALDKPLYFGDVRPMDWPQADYRLIDADTDLALGLRVLLAPGHTVGQLALMVDLPQTGTVLLTGDAISRPAEVEERFAGTTEAAQALASAQRILGLAKGAMVIYGHCPAQWPDLRKAPDAYL
jgi:N-acyl homoserine lactone hydrolase